MLLFFCVLFVIIKKTDRAVIPEETFSSVDEATFTYEDIYASEEEQDISFFNGKAYVPKEDIETILILGIDSEGEPQASTGYRNTDQCDAVMLLVIDHAEKTYSLLQLNRETMTDITVVGATGDFLRYDNAQLALSHTYGTGLNDSCEYTADAVSWLLYGQTIDHYASFSLDCIEIINDKVGGVTVTVPVDMSSKDPAMEEGATITLQGDQAETFVRSRMGLEDSSNSERMERQRIFLEAWQGQVRQMASNDAGFALELILQVSQYMVSDMDAGQLSDVANELLDYTSNGIYTIEGESVQGEEFMEFYADDASIQTVVAELFYNETEI
ncbi:MAG: LCP family protein [Clostridiales bacterium]|nr:LCP family protein [Clostridiales bacterium]